MQAIVNSIRMHWRDEGEGEPIVFIHGFPFNSRMWDPQFSALPAGWRAIAPDLRGFGASAAGPAGPYTMDQFADDIAGLIDHLGIRNAVICGLSMGGYVAFALHRRHREKVRALVLCNTRPGADTEEARRGRLVQAARVREEGVAPVVESMLPRLMSDLSVKKHPDLVGRVRGIMESTPPETMARSLEGMAQRPSSEDQLRDIAVSTLIVHGDDDAIVPRGEAQMMARNLRGARMEMLEDCGHLSNLEYPGEFNRHLNDFLENLPAGYGKLKLA